jgi:gluconolactonase
MNPLSRPVYLLAATLAVASAAYLPGQARSQSPGAGDVLRFDPALDRLVPPGAKVEKLAGNLQRAEGPVWIRSGGYLLFSDLNEIMKWAPDSPVSILRSRIFSGTTPPGVRVGTNGLTLDREGRLVGVEPGNRRVSRFDSGGQATVLADRYMGKRLNSPNDLVIKKSGEVYFTDPPYFAGQPVPPTSPEFRQELEFNGVYRVTNAGKLELLVRDLGFPNGLAFSPDERKLYVADSRPRKKWMVYDVKGDGTLGTGKVFIDMSVDTTEAVPDGMKVDTLGNIYATGPGGVLVISPEGKHLGTIQIPEIAANSAWGDPEGKTLYVTARSGLYRIKLNVAGVRP